MPFFSIIGEQNKYLCDFILNQYSNKITHLKMFSVTKGETMAEVLQGQTGKHKLTVQLFKLRL